MQLLQEERNDREQKIVDNYKADRNLEFYQQQLKNNNRSHRHMVTRVNDYFAGV